MQGLEIVLDVLVVLAVFAFMKETRTTTTEIEKKLDSKLDTDTFLVAVNSLIETLEEEKLPIIKAIEELTEQELVEKMVEENPGVFTPEEIEILADEYQAPAFEVQDEYWLKEEEPEQIQVMSIEEELEMRNAAEQKPKAKKARAANKAQKKETTTIKLQPKVKDFVKRKNSRPGYQNIGEVEKVVGEKAYVAWENTDEAAQKKTWVKLDNLIIISTY